jgi:ATP-dependent Clp protease ATP-binding subunit ClpA
VLNQYHTDRFKVSFVLFDEIEKASDALWNLLLGILDKATLTLGDNHRVDFSRAMIFMTSNLGSAEMSSIIKPKLGFGAAEVERRQASGEIEEGLQGKIHRAGLEAARRKFTPEFMNRLDRVVVFRPLGTSDLKKILSIELNLLQQRIFNSAQTTPFVLNMSEPAKEFLLREGTDIKYGARHLKRTIERSLVHPLSNLIASGQIRNGDLVRVDFDNELGILTFTKEAENIPGYEMVQMSDAATPVQAAAAAMPAELEAPRAASAKSTRRY